MKLKTKKVQHDTCFTHETIKQLFEYCGENNVLFCNVMQYDFMTRHVKIKYTDMVKSEQEKLFSKRILDYMCVPNPDEVSEIWCAMYNFEIGIQMNGLGGCKYKTLKQLIIESRDVMNNYYIVKYGKESGHCYGTVAGLGRNKNTWDANHSKRTAMKYAKQLNKKSIVFIYKVETL